MANIEAAQSPPPPRAKQKRKLQPPGAHAPSPRGNVCRNPFCGATLSSAFAKFCARKAHCQLYRGLLLQCESVASSSTGATARERAVDVALEKLRATKRRKLARSTSESERAPSSSASAAATSSATRRVTHEQFSIPKRKVPAGVFPVVVGSRATGSEGDKVRQRFEKVQAAAVASEGTASSSLTPVAVAADTPSASETTGSGGKKRRLAGAVGTSGASDSGGLAKTAPVTPSSSRPPTPVGKTGGIEVIPLGAGRHATSFAGGSRYVQSGNRMASNADLRANNPLSRPPSVSIPPPLPPTLDPVVAAALPPPRSSSVDTRLPYRAPVWVDARRAEAGGAGRTYPVVGLRNEATPSSSPVLAHDSHAAASAAWPVRGRRISASEYLSSRSRPQDPRVRPTEASGDPLGAVGPSSSATLRRAASDLSSVPASAFPNNAPRTLSRSLSEWSGQLGRSDASFRGAEPGFARPSAEHAAASGSRSTSVPSSDPFLNRPPSAYEAPAYSRREYDPRDVSYRSERPPPSRAYLPERYHEFAYEPEFHRPSSSSYPTQERPEWQRRSEDPPRPSYREPVPSTSAAAAIPSRAKADYNDRAAPQPQPQPQPQPPAPSSANAMLPEIVPVAFSSHDRFIRNLLSRIASFFPTALAPVLNKTKKPRKMRFYTDYAKRVEELSGSRLKVDVVDGKGRVSLAGREWLLLKGSSTVALYVQVLETLLDQGNAWRKLVEDSHRVYANAVKRSSDSAVRSTAFIRLWQGMKYNQWDNKFQTERQVTYFRGDTRHHWTFCVGNVEIGSGSHEEKREAFQLAAADAMQFLLSLEILSDSQKYAYERDRDRERERDRDRERERDEQTDGRNARGRSQGAGASETIEIVDDPEATMSRPRGSSFDSDVDGAFSPADRNAGDDDMDISDSDDGGACCGFHGFASLDASSFTLAVGSADVLTRTCCVVGRTLLLLLLLRSPTSHFSRRNTAPTSPGVSVIRCHGSATERLAHPTLTD